MALTVITAVPTAAQTTAVNTALTSIETNEPYKANLTDEEKNNYPTTADERYPYVVKGIRDLAATWVPKMAPRIGAGLAKAQTSLTVKELYRSQKQRLLMLLEFFNDAEHIAGYQCMDWLSDFYGQAKALQAAGEAGADSLVADLAPLFAKTEAATATPGPV